MDSASHVLLEKAVREIGDLRAGFIALERTFRKAGRADRQRGGAFIAQAAMAMLGHLRRHEKAAEWKSKAAVPPAMTTVPGWAQELATSATADFILSLASGVYGFPTIAARAHGFELAANRRVIIGGSATAAFVGEGEPIGAVIAAVKAASLRPYSVKVLTEFSNDLAEHSQPSIEALLRKILSNAIGECLDTVFFSDDAATSRSPAGILNGLTPETGGGDFAGDIQALMSAISPAADPVFVVSPARRAGLASEGRLLGFDYAVIASSAVPDNRTIAIDADDLAVGFGGQPKFSISDMAALVELTQDEVGALMATGPVRSTWQTDTSALKASLPVSWYAAPGSVAYTEAP